MVNFKRVSGRRIWLLTGLSALVILTLTGCGTKVPTSSVPSGPLRIVRAVGAENEYANIVSQIGGKYVLVSSIMNNPNVDPHSYEADTRDAALVAQSSLIVQNGLGYDDFMNKLESASPDPKRVVINVAGSLGYPPNTPNPHLWYDPSTMPKVAALITNTLEQQIPGQTPYFAARLAAFDESLLIWQKDLAAIRQTYPGARVAVTEPVADYMLQAAGLNIATPWGFQTAIMNGTDPAPQDVAIQENLIKKRQVKALVYNLQAVDDVTTTLLQIAKANDVPVVGVYETMPSGLTYQTWMDKETKNLMNALKNGISTETLS